jgi:hypothetical protein
MKDEQLTQDYLRNELKHAINSAHRSFTSCTMSTIHWLQRYSHCYSIVCSFICFPLWILILPIALGLDLCIYAIIAIIFIITFVIHILLAPCKLTHQFSSCSDAWNPANIYRYSLTRALMWSETTFVLFQIFWLCYCGSGELEDGAPICCTYICCTKCHRACNQATHVRINDQPCTIL